MALRHLLAVAGRLKDLNGGFCGVREEVIVEGIGPEDNRWAWVIFTAGACGTFPEPCGECFASECRHFAFLGDAADGFGDAGEKGSLGNKVDDFGVMRSHLCPAGDLSHGIRAGRTHAVFVVVMQELGLVSRDIYIDRAVSLASFAGEAQVERIFYMFIVPAVLDYFSAQHLEEQAGAASGAVHLFARGMKAGAHGAAVHSPALADAKTALRGFGKAAVIGGKLKHGQHGFGAIVGTDAQIGIERIGVDNLARIHPPFGIPRGFELAKSLHQLGTEHDGQ